MKETQKVLQEYRNKGKNKGEMKTDMIMRIKEGIKEIKDGSTFLIVTRESERAKGIKESPQKSPAILLRWRIPSGRVARPSSNLRWQGLKLSTTVLLVR